MATSRVLVCRERHCQTSCVPPSSEWEINHQRLLEAIEAWERSEHPSSELVRRFAPVEDCLAVDR
jgi:hypothetical protein